MCLYLHVLRHTNSELLEELSTGPIKNNREEV